LARLNRKGLIGTSDNLTLTRTGEIKSDGRHLYDGVIEFDRVSEEGTALSMTWRCQLPRALGAIPDSGFAGFLGCG